MSHTRIILPATAELLERIGWFIHLRWVAIGGVVVFVGLGRRLLPVDFHLGPVLITLLLLATYNALATLYCRKLSGLADAGSPFSRPGKGSGRPLARWLLPQALRQLGYHPELLRAAYFVNVQMVLDLVFLAILLHFSGGIENPLRMFFLFHVIIAGILLSRRATYSYATLAFLLMTGVALGELMEWLPHYALNAHWRSTGYRDLRLVGTQLFLLGATLFITAYLGSSIGARLRSKGLVIMLLKKATEEKAEHLKLALGQVTSAERAKSQYMRKVAHEIRGPLGTIKSALSVVLERNMVAADVESLDLLRRAERRAREMGEMTRELLSLSRARDGKAMADAVHLDPEGIAHRVLEEMGPRAQAAGLDLNVEMEPPFPKMKVDPEGIGDLLTNLLSNAIRYTPSPGSITLVMREDAGGLLIEVSDTGIGIEEEALDRISEEFYRSEAARAYAPDGSGLGMSIVKAVVEQHRGTITVESETGRGTRFTVRLPVERTG